jgi:dTDP-4-amino-4,6-dideoxygalactose transaminase
MHENIYVTRPTLPELDEYIEYLKQIWNSHSLTNMGELCQKFHQKLSDYMNVEYCLPLTNGHMALELVIQAFGLSGEVITTPYTFASTTHAIVRNNLTPVFCDIRESDCTIDADKIEDLITDNTCAIVPVHVYGMPCDVEKIERIAKIHNLRVIYDAAHAFGESLNGKNIAAFGDASMFSFHATKCFNSIEGGCAVLHDDELLLRLYQLHNFGIMDEENVDFVGANAKMNEFQAAMGLCNLEHFEENRLKRKRIFELYRTKLSGVDGIRLLHYDEDRIRYNYSYLPIFIDESKFSMNRNAVYEYLLTENVHARKYFYPITSKFNCYKDIPYKGNTPIAEKLAEQVLALPMYADLDMKSVESICELILKLK